MNINVLISSIYAIAFLLILIVFNRLHKDKNPFRVMRFWVIQIIAAVSITVLVLVILVNTLFKKYTPDDNLGNHFEQESISAVMIIQWKDTVQINDVARFLDKMHSVQQVLGPVKFQNKGRIIVIRKNGRKDSIHTNGHGYGPYKGKWYQSDKNVLEEYFKEK
ncbi:hypothetical protein [Cytophaga hutchinsonii]|uniref:Uncharacterized protein n=1 Tax=Cytophaga hutchinsonii (strain ATCC 33406 / DSM 1761 / CIP 103989 / NBRC 15051 / NCIMB 9469 / D465) TaxID=269798 RepID=A0A6N4SQ62_CYTH3|nr:hypothetical protein [Cytophaga hutchinsonii]ABG58422.1 hypothetical protein CHU_1147 [Cytophaga hutchinsonii ATCC 33406]SFX50485.1 hypothetical protein SAMN04487930_10510 [Cytophaga hutchinsonii ATCC 33406]